MSTVHPIWFIGLAVVLAGVPILISLCTSFLKVSIVLSLLKNAFGAQQFPGGVIVMGLSLAITLGVMAPTFDQSPQVLDPLAEKGLPEKITLSDLKAYAPVIEPWREFMLKHAGQRELKALAQMNGTPSEEAPSLKNLIPAFVISELKEAFAMGCMLLIPFLVVDLIVANILVGLGMFMVSPVLISLPLKLVLFVLADGWLIVSQALMQSYQV